MKKDKSNKKLNEGCLKIFHFLHLLYEDKAEYSKVVEIFNDEIKEPSANNIQVTLNKYINTLKVFGLKVEKEKSKYKLKSSIYKVPLNMADLKAISILANSIHNFQNPNLVQEVQNFLQQMELRMYNEDKNTLNSLITDNKYDFSFYYSELREQINKCEQICIDKHVINILYVYRGKQRQRKCVPKEVVYDCKNAYLKIYDTNKHTVHEIPINMILSIDVYPNKANGVELNSTTVYKLKNRLAKSYRLKEGEHSNGFDEDGNLIVINNTESSETLLPRLLRYTYNCEIISPKPMREEMLKLINEMMNNYDKDE